MSNSSFLYQIGSPQVCLGDVHVYPTIYAGDPEYAEEFFSHCICGAKKKITTVTEVDVAPQESRWREMMAKNAKFKRRYIIELEGKTTNNYLIGFLDVLFERVLKVLQHQHKQLKVTKYEVTDL